MPGAGDRWDYLIEGTSSGELPAYLEGTRSRTRCWKCVLWAMHSTGTGNLESWRLLGLSIHSCRYTWPFYQHWGRSDSQDIVPAAKELTTLSGKQTLDKKLRWKMSTSHLLFVLFLPLPFLLF